MRLPFRLRRGEHDAQALASARYVVFDTELTSLDRRTGRLLSVGALAMEGSRIRLGGEFYRLVNPGVEVPAPGVLIHGLRPHDVSQGGSAGDVAVEFEQFAAGAILVGHFVSIDLRAIRAARPKGFPQPAVDTAQVHAWLLRSGPLTEEAHRALDRLDLESVARAHGVEPRHAHHALGDAWVTALLWQRLLAALERRNIVTIGDLRGTRSVIG